MKRSTNVERPTLQPFQDLERDAAAQTPLDWRFQQALYRAYHEGGTP